jgi:hypothetical protein
MTLHRGCLFAVSTCALFAQPVSSYTYTVKGDEKSVEIVNVNYQLTGLKDLLVLRSTTKSKQVIGDIGQEASTTVETWKVGTDLKTKPIYSVTATGTETRVVENEIFLISRGTEEVEWWSAYRLSNGAHLFDTYLPLVNFSISRDTVAMRYVGLQIPEDQVKDPQMVAEISYASEAKVIRKLTITCDDPNQAAQLRSLADETRTMTGGASLKLTFSQSYPAPPATVAITIPIVKDDLDLAHAVVPSKMHLR